MNLLQMVPIFIPSGGGGPMTESEYKTMIGVWILLNGLWVISIIISVIKYLTKRYDWGYSPNRWYNNWDEIGWLLIQDGLMILIWVIIGIIEAGEFIGNLI